MLHWGHFVTPLLTECQREGREPELTARRSYIFPASRYPVHTNGPDSANGVQLTGDETYITAFLPFSFECVNKSDCLGDLCSLLQDLAMKAYFAILLSIASLATATGSAGCGKSLPKHQGAGGSYPTDFTTSDGTQRSYIIHIPSNYDVNRAIPLIFFFHGRTKTAESQEQLSQFSNEAWNPGAIAVYPQGLDVSVSNSPYSTY